MTLTRTLWDILDTREDSSSIVDTRDPEVEGDYFQDKTSRVRWRIGVTTALALSGAILLVVVGAFFFRSARPALPEVAPALGASQVEELESLAPVNDIVVHVVGAVLRPGVVRVPEFSRVEDALALVGGPTAEAELSGVNLAREVFDGEQIVVPKVGEEPLAGSSAENGPISLSRSDQATLETLPRIGPATALRIIAWREENGPFRSVEDLLAVSGIGPATLEGVVGLVVP
jgi:competence protein ComEA